MERCRVKICGLKTVEDVLAVNEVQPDYAGFVFAPGRRQISEELAAELRKVLAREIVPVGVFVNENPEKVLRLCDRGIIDLIQLHGEESEEYIATLRSRVGTPIVKAVRVRSTEDILRMDAVDSDFLLLDAYHEKEYGGSGISFDWSLIPAVSKPFFLAGGINAGNVREAILTFRPYGIDVSSGVETEGRKDSAKLKQLLQLIREINEAGNKR